MKSFHNNLEVTRETLVNGVREKNARNTLVVASGILILVCFLVTSIWVGDWRWAVTGILVCVGAIVIAAAVDAVTRR